MAGREGTSWHNITKIPEEEYNSERSNNMGYSGFSKENYYSGGGGKYGQSSGFGSQESGKDYRKQDSERKHSGGSTIQEGKYKKVPSEGHRRDELFKTEVDAEDQRKKDYGWKEEYAQSPYGQHLYNRIPQPWEDQRGEGSRTTKPEEEPKEKPKSKHWWHK